MKMTTLKPTSRSRAESKNANSTRIRKSRHEESSSSILPLVKLLLVLLILLLLPDLVTSKRRTSPNRKKKNRIAKSFNALKSDCINDCDPTNMAENEMCITQCMSSECHDGLYKGDELEPGEIDERRGLAFEQCAKDEIRKQESQRRRGHAISPSATADNIADESAEDESAEDESSDESNDEDEGHLTLAQDEVIIRQTLDLQGMDKVA